MESFGKYKRISGKKHPVNFVATPQEGNLVIRNSNLTKKNNKITITINYSKLEKIEK